jgi:hypothetical protein
MLDEFEDWPCVYENILPYDKLCFFMDMDWKINTRGNGAEFK